LLHPKPWEGKKKTNCKIVERGFKKRMQGLPYEIKLHLLTYMGAREYCHFVQTCRSFATINQQDTNKLFYQMYLRDYDPLVRPFTRVDMEEWFVPFSDTMQVSRMPEQSQLKEFMDDIESTPLKNGKRLEQLRTPKYVEIVDWRRLYQLMHATKMNALKMMRQHAQSLFLHEEVPKVSTVKASPGHEVGAILHFNSRGGQNHSLDLCSLYVPSGDFGHFAMDLNVDIVTDLHCVIAQRVKAIGERVDEEGFDFSAAMANLLLKDSSPISLSRCNN
jgi:hypothetical protein